MADVFIGYSDFDREQAEALAAYLKSEGYDVWWDKNLVPGQSFEAVIAEQLRSVKAAIIIWSKASVTSDWVKGEAAVARQRKVLIPVRTQDVGYSDVPLPYQSLRTETIDQRAAILGALRQLGVEPRYAPSPVDLFWGEIEKSRNAEDFQLYLAIYPDGRHAPIAQLRIQQLHRRGRRRLGGESWKRPAASFAGAVVVLVALTGLLAALALPATSGSVVRGVVKSVIWPIVITPQREEADESAWRVAEVDGTIRSWTKYLALARNDRHGGTARERIAKRKVNRLIGVLEGHGKPVTEVKMFAGYRRLDSVDTDGTHRSWDVLNLKVLQTVRATKDVPRALVPLVQARDMPTIPTMDSTSTKGSAATKGKKLPKDAHAVARKTTTINPGEPIDGVVPFRGGYIGFRSKELIYWLNDPSARSAVKLPIDGTIERIIPARSESAVVVLLKEGGFAIVRFSDRKVFEFPLAVTHAVFSADDRLVVTAGADGSVRVISLLSGAELLELKCHVGQVRSVDISDDSAVIASGGDDGKVCTFDVSDL